VLSHDRSAADTRLVVAVAVVAASARRLGLSAPLVLTVVGLLASFLPGVPDYQVSPEVVLIGFLPPLLYAAAIRTSLVDVRQNREAIGILAIGAVVFTTFGVGLVAWTVIPGVGSLPLWRSRGRVTTGRRRGDDHRAASQHAATDRVDPRGREPAQRCDGPRRPAHKRRRDRDHGVDLDGRAGLRPRRRWRHRGRARHVALLAKARRRVDDVVLDTTLSLVAPFLAYLAAEAVNASGCARGRHRRSACSGTRHPPSSRHRPELAEQTNWQTSPSSSRTPSSY